MKSSSMIRKEFIEFFTSKAHIKVAAASVVPTDDPTLMFTVAGMTQFKNIFLGLTKPSVKRAVNSQKCIRAGGKHNDLEEVGKDSYHHTFFEMLGSWSFGDYYKKEAISWAWELFTKVWELPKELLHATVHTSDQEAHAFWLQETDINPAQLTYHADKDNFWEMGEVGPCGPCSEIHIDRGIEYCNLQADPNHTCAVNGDCHRYIELWNLVFIQFERQTDRSLVLLNEKYVDTGAGFERICQVIQDKSSNYETDLFMPLINKIVELSKQKYDKGEAGIPHRVIADHVRCLSFAIADGGMPSNEGAGYVLRRILRRAARYGRKLGLTKPFMHLLVETLIEVMGDYFGELVERETHIKMIIKAEEERFNVTLDRGLEKFREIAEKSNKLISGTDAFMLYDTFGFPLDLSILLAEEQGLEINQAEFTKAMTAQKELARQSSKFVQNMEKQEWHVYADGETEFIGYTDTKCTAKLLKFSNLGKNKFHLVYEQTPFYAEAGGQVGDKGTARCADYEVQIYDVQKINNQIVHLAKLTRGILTDATCELAINEAKRGAIAVNHAATHILHKALKQVLGTHVQQKGSLVNAKQLRFDFTHFQAVSGAELKEVENMANAEIRKCLAVSVEEMAIDEAKIKGATALFGEKYGDVVRVASVGDFSLELCGGTHIKNTGQIGLIKIVAESSVAAGIRRIEALTAAAAISYYQAKELLLAELSAISNSPEKKLVGQVQKLLDDKKKAEKALEILEAKLAGNETTDLLATAKDMFGLKTVIGKVKNPKAMRTMADQIMDKLASGVCVLVGTNGKNVSLVVKVSRDQTDRINAGTLIKELVSLVGGKGGGRPDMAMAGGNKPEAIGKVLEHAPGIIKKLLT